MPLTLEKLQYMSYVVSKHINKGQKRSLLCGIIVTFHHAYFMMRQIMTDVLYCELLKIEWIVRVREREWK